MRNAYRTNNKNVERLLTDIYILLLKMENRLNVIETSMQIEKKRIK